MSETQIVCVLGMHRSGSSLLAQVLVGNGYVVGPRLVGASSTNEMGHYEDRFVVNVNKRILGRFGGTWDRPPNLPADWLADRVVRRELERARRYRDEVVARHERFLFKDPRTCLVLPFWREAFGEMRFVVTLRDREYVATSILSRQERWLSPGKVLWRFGRNVYHRLQRAYEPLMPIDRRQALHLWDVYYDAIARTASGAGVVPVHYERLVANPEVEVPALLRALRPGIDTFSHSMIKPELNHGARGSSVSDEALEVADRIRG